MYLELTETKREGKRLVKLLSRTCINLEWKDKLVALLFKRKERKKELLKRDTEGEKKIRGHSVSFQTRESSRGTHAEKRLSIAFEPFQIHGS